MVEKVPGEVNVDPLQRVLPKKAVAHVSAEQVSITHYLYATCTSARDTFARVSLRHDLGPVCVLGGGRQ